MTKKEMLIASECDYNFLWKCKHPDKTKEKCTGLCEKAIDRGNPLKLPENEKQKSVC